MKIERTLNMSPEEFYEAMQESMAHQINVELSKSLSPEDIQTGYSHKVKTTTKNGTRTTRFAVVKAIPGKEMVISHHSQDARSKTSYKIFPDPAGLKLVFEQNTEYLNSDVKPSGIRLRITDILSIGKINRQLTDLEMKIEKKRKKKKAQ
ncbi:DUF3284 domain-containing protein [Ileibacterium valens]|nr:DUF3284 domain-containing protein [Ileibacterium valens]